MDAGLATVVGTLPGGTGRDRRAGKGVMQPGRCRPAGPVLTARAGEGHGWCADRPAVSLQIRGWRGRDRYWVSAARSSPLLRHGVRQERRLDLRVHLP